MNQNIKNILKGFTVLFIIIIIAFILKSILLKDKIKITAYVAPNDSSIYINNKKVNKNFIYVNANQEYEIKIEKKGFSTRTLIKKFDKDIDNYIISNLYPETDEARKWFEEHKNQFLEIEKIAGTKGSERGKQESEKFPYTKELPIINKALNYRIGFFFDEDRLILSIYGDKNSRQYAIKKLLALNFDLSKYEIRFYDINKSLEENRQVEISPLKEYENE